jgi:hypothetical protein
MLVGGDGTAPADMTQDSPALTIAAHAAVRIVAAHRRGRFLNTGMASLPKNVTCD